ncbi:DUF721 domain-containing protein [Methylosinus sporium]|uniref:DUF721 domain-containing protein n=1 Tax=Methylosinus sporium TaxID=428 RepID=A0A2U1STR2_METSR|nr:DciA family protein [Methylosinus sporium]PWB94998.1 DUF721 domain-containing protein [Methylosinus sporium]
MTGAATGRSKIRQSRLIGEFIDRTLDPLAARHGFSESSLLLRWEAIVGARVAAICEPVKLQWPPRAKRRAADENQTGAKRRAADENQTGAKNRAADENRAGAKNRAADENRAGAKNRAAEKEDEPATLALRVEPGFGLDIQHMSAAIIERVNTHLGWRCVAKITMKQEPLAPRRVRPAKPPVDLAARRQAEAATEGVADERLRAALVTLGERALAKPAR